MAGGRPSKYGDINLDKVKLLASKGWTDIEMSEFFDVDVRTWHRWKGDHEEFCHSLKGWKGEADKRVERALFDRAIGYSHIDTKFATFEGEITDTKEYVKHCPPDPTSAIFWLKNRKPSSWRDRREEEITIKEVSLVPPNKPS